MTTLANRDLKAAIDSLKAVGSTSLPIPIAIRMAKLRQNLERHAEAVEATRAGLIASLTNGGSQIAANEAAWPDFVKGFEELMAQEYALPDRFTLYHKGDGYAWSENLKTGKLVDMAPNVLYGLLPLIDIVEVEG